MFFLKPILAIIVGKTILIVNKITGSGGTAAPGLIALKICPDLVKKLARQLDKNILITGTNGKTTTARMVSSILKQAKIKYFHNRVGSNLLRGVASTLLKNSYISGKMPKDYWGLWETDEAVFPIICGEVQPQIVLITNLFRDQLDRYGEINTLAGKWKRALNSLPKNSVVILNADDAAVAGLGKNLQQKTLYFGLSDPKLPNKNPDHASDATVCPYCQNELTFKKCYVGHMGNYYCKKCGAIQPKKDFIFPRCLEYSTPEVVEKIKKNIPGNYNFYNISAAFALASILKINKQIIIKGFLSFKSAFGRVEKIKTGEKTLNIFLVKNPTGFNEVIETLINTPCHSHTLKKDSSPSLSFLRKQESIQINHSNKLQTASGMTITCLIVINDLIADGTDISWLWDVHFEKLAPYLKKVIVSGTRAYDMALRLKYSQTSSNLIIQPNLKSAISHLLSATSNKLYILPTYTAMLETRKILNQMGLVHSSWED